jgi:beta-lactam-binding protein with PASTA domain
MLSSLSQGSCLFNMKVGIYMSAFLMLVCVPLATVSAEIGTVPMTLEASVSASSDDAEQTPEGYFSTNSSDLELVVDTGVQTVGMRFNGMVIPRGASVTDAYIQFQVDEVTSDVVSLSIRGEADDNAATFSVAGDVLSRIQTVAAVPWSPAAWPVAGVAEPDQQTPNIAPVIQEIVNRPGWVIGNSLVIMITGSGKRVAESYDGNPNAAPLLHVEYLISDQEPPTVDAGPDQVIVLPESASLDGSVEDDGLPFPPGMVFTTWSQVSGPGTASFVDASAIDTAASFSIAGTYVLGLSANDGERFGGDEVTITVNPAIAPPVINSFTPTSDQVATVVAITGSNFSDAQYVGFNGVSSTFWVGADNTIYATVPVGVTTGPISVSNWTGVATSTTDFSPLASPPVLIGAGDISDCIGNAEETAKLLDTIPGTVFTAGDHAYDDGTEIEFDACYEPTWGRHKARTRPSPGAADYDTPGASAYYNYFGPSAGEPGKGYYSYDVGDWHVVALNSECGEVGGCDSSSPQGQWLQEDLANNPTACTIAYWSAPRFSSSSTHGSDPTYNDFWQILYAAGAELVVNGHDHTYERFAPQAPSGAADPLGIREFVVGTGGRALYPIGVTEPNSEVHNVETHGVLKLTLNPGSYDWEFIPIAGQTFTDSGSGLCHQVNQGPIVEAGPDQVITWPDSVVLEGQALDDGLPNPPGTLTTNWTQISGPGTASFVNSSAVDTTVSFSQFGSYVLRLTGDDGEHVVTDDVAIIVVDGGTQIISTEIRVTAGSDDAEESVTDGSMYLTSSDLELVSDLRTIGSDQTVGMRFNGAGIPQGVTVSSAYLQFQVDEVGTDFTSLTIRGEAIDNSPTFVSANGNLSARNRTAASVPWLPGPWSTAGAAGPDQQTPDLSAVIQEIVNRPGWSSGNSLTIIINGTGQRTAESYDGDPAAAPLLLIQYEQPANQPPTVSITGPADGTSVVEGTALTFAGTANDGEEGNLGANLAWNSSLQGALGNGVSVDATLSAGVHTITASATDSGGLSGSDQITVTITVPPIDVPNVAGLAQATAEANIVAAGLTVGTITTANSSTVPAGNVITQSPVACTACAIAGDPVALMISIGPASIDIPNVIGLAQATAEANIVAAGLTVGTITTANSSTVPAGNVITQSPLACTACATAGDPVALMISTGPAAIDIPNVIGLVQATAEANIVAAGLTVGTVTTANSATVPAGNVITQSPLVCSACALPGDAIALMISLGPAAIDVPNVAGLAQATAEANIVGAGLTVGTVITSNSATVPAGNVITQSPVACTACVTAGDLVALMISTGPAPIDVPNVVGQAQATAEANLVAAGLSVGTVTTASSGTVPAGDVISQSPINCTACVAPGSPVDLVVSTGAPKTLPGVTITFPPDGLSVVEGIAVTFTGTVNDSEDGDLSANLVWSSSRDGVFGTGASISTTLSKGWHTITASVTDSGGLSGSDQISIRVWNSKASRTH